MSLRKLLVAGAIAASSLLHSGVQAKTQPATQATTQYYHEQAGWEEWLERPTDHNYGHWENIEELNYKTPQTTPSKHKIITSRPRIQDAFDDEESRWNIQQLKERLHERDIEFHGRQLRKRMSEEDEEGWEGFTPYGQDQLYKKAQVDKFTNALFPETSQPKTTSRPSTQPSIQPAPQTNSISYLGLAAAFALGYLFGRPNKRSN